MELIRADSRLLLQERVWIHSPGQQGIPGRVFTGEPIPSLGMILGEKLEERFWEKD